MSISYQKIPPFPFYSLREFTQLQPLIKNKTTIYLYQHNQSHQIFAVKEIPYSQRALKIYEVVMKRQSLDSLVRLRGLCLMVIKYGYKHRRIEKVLKQQKTDEQVSKTNINPQKYRPPSYAPQKEIHSLLLFMQKCDCDMLEVIRCRRNQRKAFHSEQIWNFIREMLFLLETLEKDGVSHRDIKPENFLYDHGRYRLCDFQSAVFLGQLSSETDKQNQYLDMTTFEYTSPEFYKNLKNPKKKIFDPFKLDVYALGITILYMCSLGKFDLFERKQYLIQDSVFHEEYMKEERRKILKNRDQYKEFNTIVKNMLEQDEYKRDTFQTLVLKMNPIINIKVVQNIDMEIYSTKSEESKNQINTKPRKSRKSKRNLWPASTQIQRKSLLSLLIFGLSFFVLILVI